MAGIYIHIPFCSQACHYCDFHFSTNLKPRTEMVMALIQELELRKGYMKGAVIKSIYFGGGTPSILSSKELADIFANLAKHYRISDSPEITLEANPEDLTLAKLKELRKLGINRLSIGIQTFDDESLKFMNRAHDSETAHACIQHARTAGFDNISADLIFAVPPVATTIHRFENDLQKMLALNPDHISLYSLTIEPKTVFGNRHAKKTLKEVSDELNAIQYEMAIDTLTSHGYEHYEVSNFGKPEYESKHNSSYWLGQPYIGIGPGAHSFDGESRSYNVSNNAGYMKVIMNGKLPSTEEKLSLMDQMNEYILTRIRTKWGISFLTIEQNWKVNFETIYGDYIKQLIDDKKAVMENDHLRLTSRGLCVADEISLHFFSTE